ncbi:hypothetical protein J6590_069320 [Homalodisca vitripennis]|nr:hypothetical protein J6590_069320 [Homalodisca vitripennis]
MSSGVVVDKSNKIKLLDHAIKVGNNAFSLIYHLQNHSIFNLMGGVSEKTIFNDFNGDKNSCHHMSLTKQLRIANSLTRNQGSSLHQFDNSMAHFKNFTNEVLADLSNLYVIAVYKDSSS